MTYSVRGMSSSEELAHYGVKGMHWGVRKERDSSKDIHVKLKNGDEMTLDNRPTSRMIKLIDRVNVNRNNKDFGRQNFHIKNKDGVRVGEMYMFSQSRDTLHVAWIGVKDQHRGHGYATAAMKAAVDNAKKQGFKDVSLQAIAESEDAVHIYRKMGFKEYQAKNEPVDGLIDMKLKL